MFYRIVLLKDNLLNKTMNKSSNFLGTIDRDSVDGENRNDPENEIRLGVSAMQTVNPLSFQVRASEQRWYHG